MPGQRPAVRIGAEAALIVGVHGDAVRGRVSAELREGVAVVVEAVDRQDHRPRRPVRQPGAPRHGRAVERGLGPGRTAGEQPDPGEQERHDAKRPADHPAAGAAAGAGAGSGRPSSCQISSGRRPDCRSVRTVIARLRLASRSPFESAIRL